MLECGPNPDYISQKVRIADPMRTLRTFFSTLQMTYIEIYKPKNYPDLDVESNAFRKAIDQGEAKGKLTRFFQVLGNIFANNCLKDN